MNFSFIGIDTSRDAVETSIFEQSYYDINNNIIDITDLLSKQIENLAQLRCNFNTLLELIDKVDLIKKEHRCIYEIKELDLSSIFNNYLKIEDSNSNFDKIAKSLKLIKRLFNNLFDEAIKLDEMTEQ